MVSADEGTDFFEAKIRPVLVEHCYQCHSAQAANAGRLKGGLQLDTRAGIRMGGDSGPAVVPGDLEKSLLLGAIRHDPQFERMPPKGKLPDAVIADFSQWIERGAADPRDGAATTLAAIDLEKGRTFWSFVPPKSHPRPNVRDDAWPVRELDWFVRAAHEQKGVRPVRPATKPQWLRRVSFDLIGLPPTGEDLAAFLVDDSPRAWERVVDRLLASQHFGERWARHWLDVARYTDDLGGTVAPGIAPNAVRYRDWVVWAFNADLPFDQFVRLQLAGELIVEPTDDYVFRLGGLGFQGLGQRFSGNAVGMAKKKVADELDDRVDTVTRGLLGLTVSCARCHDHKFDPIPTQDYYALAAAYNGADLSTETPLASPAAVTARAEWSRAATANAGQRTALLQAEVDRVGRSQVPNLAAYLLAAWRVQTLTARKVAVDVPATAAQHDLAPVFLARWGAAIGTKKPLPLMSEWQAAAEAATAEAVVMEGTVEPSPKLVEASRKLGDQASAALRELERLEREKREKKDQPLPLSPAHETTLKVFLQNDGAIFKLKQEEISPYFAAETKRQFDELQREQERLAKTQPPEPIKGPAVANGGHALRLNIRGDAEKLGDTVPPVVLQVLSPPPTESSSSGKASPTFTRLDLARAITRRDNPLAARVYVNRVWHHLFGRGLVGTPSNFGQLGDRPSHPELLDTLSVRFMDAGWSTKWLLREIVLSATYRLSSQSDNANQRHDADNILLWRMTPRRLDFEAWRDATLAVAGQLDPTVGGPPLAADGKTLVHP